MLLSTAAATVTTVTVISSSPSPNKARMLSIRVLFLRNIINDDVANYISNDISNVSNRGHDIVGPVDAHLNQIRHYSSPNSEVVDMTDVAAIDVDMTKNIMIKLWQT